MSVKIASLCCRFAVMAAMIGSVFFPLSLVAHQNVILSWNPSTVTNVAGYKIYLGTTSQSYSTNLNAGSATNITLNGLSSGATYFVAASTYDASGTESPLSAEISFQIPSGAGELTGVTRANNQFSFAVGGVSGGRYAVEVSNDLKNWTAVQTNTAPFTFVDGDVAAHPQRFYRTAYLGN